MLSSFRILLTEAVLSAPEGPLNMQRMGPGVTELHCLHNLSNMPNEELKLF